MSLNESWTLIDPQKSGEGGSCGESATGVRSGPFANVVQERQGR
jgi:hypothetical protein